MSPGESSRSCYLDHCGPLASLLNAGKSWLPGASSRGGLARRATADPAEREEPEQTGPRECGVGRSGQAHNVRSGQAWPMRLQRDRLQRPGYRQL